MRARGGIRLNRFHSTKKMPMLPARNIAAAEEAEDTREGEEAGNFLVANFEGYSEYDIEGANFHGVSHERRVSYISCILRLTTRPCTLLLVRWSEV